MTADEFEAYYAANSHISVEKLHYHGRHAEPCSCDYPGCKGWIMGFPWEDALFEEMVRRGDRADRGAEH